MGLSVKLLTKLLIAAGVVTPPPASITYGATADAGEVNDADVVTGNRYYFDFVGGLDSNASATFAAPGKTLDYVYDWMTTDGTAGGKLAPRDSAILFKRGTTYDGFLSFNNFDSSSFGNYLVGTYGTGARPVINFKQVASTNNSNVNMFGMKRTGGRLKNISANGNKVVTFLGTPSAAFTAGETVTGGTSGATGIYQFYAGGVYNAIELTSYPTQFAAGETVTGGTSGSTVVVGTRAYPAAVVMEQTDCTVENVEITNLAGEGIQIGVGGGALGNNTTITGVTVSDACLIQSNGAGISGGNGNNISITNTTIKDCGVTGGSTSHNIYFNSITNATLSNIWSYMTTNRGNTALVLHDICSDILIENSLFEKCNNGLAINDGHGTAESFTRMTIRNNINRLHGTLSGQTQGMPYELSCMVDSVIYNNLVYGCTGRYDIKPTRGSGGADVPTNNLTISHETIYNIGDVTNGMLITGAVTAVTVQNCIFMSTKATGNLFEADATAWPQVTLRNCIFYMPNNAGNCIKLGATSYTLAGFKTWMDANRPGHGCIVNTDPLFVDAAAGDFTLQAGSPAKLAGYNSGITTGFDGNARHATTPSIGAYE